MTLARSFALIVVTASVLSTACKPAPPVENSSVRDALGNPACGDMAAWRAATNDGVKAQLECLKSQASLVAPGAVELVDTTRTIMDLAAKHEDIKALLATIMGGFKSMDSLLKSLEVKGECTAILASFQDVAKLIDKVMSLDIADLQSTFSGASDIVSALQKVQKDATSLAKCFRGQGAASGPDDIAFGKMATKLLGFREGLLNGVGSIGDKVLKKQAVGVVLSCGTGILKGLTTLGGNTACMFEDFRVIREQNAKIAQINGDLYKQPVSDQVKQGAEKSGLCLNEAAGSSANTMTRFGSYLFDTEAKDLRANVVFGSVSFRAEFCARECSNKATSTTKCNAFVADLKSRGEVGSECDSFCQRTQAANPISLCISRCCGLDERCTEEAARDSESGLKTQTQQEAEAAAEKARQDQLQQPQQPQP